jgi:hypothetical protein
MIVGAVRFLWNVTRGHRLKPWESELLKWRIETYSGIPAETLDRKAVMDFLWHERKGLKRFLAWTNQMYGYSRRAIKAQDPQEQR